MSGCCCRSDSASRAPESPPIPIVGVAYSAPLCFRGETREAVEPGSAYHDDTAVKGCRSSRHCRAVSAEVRATRCAVRAGGDAGDGVRPVAPSDAAGQHHVVSRGVQAYVSVDRDDGPREQSVSPYPLIPYRAAASAASREVARCRSSPFGVADDGLHHTCHRPCSKESCLFALGGTPSRAATGEGAR